MIKDFLVSTICKDSAFEICAPLVWTHDRLYINQSGLDETGQA